MGVLFWGAFGVLMSSFMDEGYEEDEESNVSKINLEISLGGCFWVNWGSAGALLGLRLGSIRGQIMNVKFYILAGLVFA